MGSRRRSREMAVQVLYQADMARVDINKALGVFCEHFEVTDSIKDFAIELVRGVDLHRVEIDGLIKRFSEHWRLERMSIVDRNILRLAVFELLNRPDIPAKVSINEAVDLGKKFGSEDSGSFINGILDGIRLHLEQSGRRKTPPTNDPTFEQAGETGG
ncbi:MAG: transcription antitermination factor NusB [Syntrophobacterales bacterium]